MRFVTVNDLSLKDLQAMATGALEATVSDLDFLETLAAHHCLIVVPWVMRANANGGLTKITRVIYDFDGEIDKARVLVATARQLRKLRDLHFGGRFSE